MSCYLCSSETISIVADVVSTNFNVEVEEAFKELLDYNHENLEKRYNEKWEDYPREYKRLEYSEAQAIQSIRNYLYQTDDYVNNYLIEWLQEYSRSRQCLIDNADEKIYWDAEDKYIETPEPQITGLEGKGKTIQECARLIKKELNARYAGSAKFSVTSSRFYGTINIKILRLSKEYTYDREALRGREHEYRGVDVVDSIYANDERIIKDSTIAAIRAAFEKYNYKGEAYDGLWYIHRTIRNENVF